MCRSPPADTLIGSCGRSIWARDGLCLVSKTPKWAVPDEKVRVWKSSSTQIYPNLRYGWGKTLPPFLTKQTGSGSMRMLIYFINCVLQSIPRRTHEFEHGYIPCFSTSRPFVPSEIPYPGNAQVSCGGSALPIHGLG